MNAEVELSLGLPGGQIPRRIWRDSDLKKPVLEASRRLEKRLGFFSFASCLLFFKRFLRDNFDYFS
jgi:hypothetical protein